MSNKDLIGKTPGAQFSGDDYSIKIAIVQRVDEVNMKADLKILTGAPSERFEIPLSQGLYGPRSFWGGVPEVNSLAIIGYRRIQSKLHEATILGYLPAAIRSSWRFDPIAPDDPAKIDESTRPEFEALFGKTTRFKRLYLKQGEVGGMSSAGAEFTLTSDVRAMNRAGDALELRAIDRTRVLSSIHRVENEAGIRRISGPLRRSAFFLPEDIFESDGTLRSEESSHPYYGRDELQEAGPGATKGAEPRFANADGQVLELFNDEVNFPAVAFANGRKAHYPPTIRGGSIDDPDSGADAFVEDRLEISHTTDLTQEVQEEIDGFSMDRRLPYIERVYGTLVGNTLNSTDGQRKYAQVLKPKLFDDFRSHRLGKLTLEAVDRRPTSPDSEVNTQAGAYMLRIRPPEGTRGEANAFTFAVSKQGKMFLSAPGSTNEEYPSGSKNISAEVSLGGALKAFLGASTPDRISAHITLEGGVHLDIGRDAKGNAVTVQYHSGVKTIYDGNPNENDVASDEEIRGVKRSTITGRQETLIEGSRVTTASGLYKTEADRYNLNAISGVSINAGEMNQMIAGKTQINYALQYQETVALGGKLLTVLAGGVTQTVAAGATTYTTAAGATTFNNPAGAFSVVVGTGSFSASVGAGAVSLSTAAGAMSLSAAAGAISLTAGLAINMTAAIAVSITSPQILLGGVVAVLGVVRGLPILPPGAPSLDYITNLPLQGSAVVRAM
jgi:hypothetical protein